MIAEKPSKTDTFVSQEDRPKLVMKEGVISTCRVCRAGENSILECGVTECPLHEYLHSTRNWIRWDIGRVSEAILRYCAARCGWRYPRCNADGCRLFLGRRNALSGISSKKTDSWHSNPIT